ncbi:unnamed protein product [Clonostachys chloroleuca]|uniref:Uncharacterized protein n=1 Tax=Clonostachys chloroleuca TaxID=1926264 RepID=A0AA35M9G3_9HYPO|nr:unnamed protein product [Clonostachys chloroleuca]
MTSRFVYRPNLVRITFGTDTLNKQPAEPSRLNVFNAGAGLSGREHFQSSRRQYRRYLHQSSHAHALQRHTRSLRRSEENSTALEAGSTIGLGKAISFRTGLPHTAVPTTYAGSERTQMLGETENGVKTTKSDPKILLATRRRLRFV